jgi:hypothetical protein
MGSLDHDRDAREPIPGHLVEVEVGEDDGERAEVDLVGDRFLLVELEYRQRLE